MSATVFDIRSGRVIPDASSKDTDVDIIKRRVRAQLEGKVRNGVIGAAISYATRIRRIEPHTSISDAVQRGIVRAVCEDDNTTPPAAA